MQRFTPPVHYQKLSHIKQKPFSFYAWPVSMSVVLRNSHFQEVRSPSQDETDALVEGETWFAGGRTYLVSDETASLLQADGFTTQPESGLPFPEGE